VTGLLTTGGQEFFDWSAPYRLFSQQRLPMPHIFSVIRRHVLTLLPADAPLRVAIDDSLLRKTGIRIPGVAWRRDPLGPRFQTNFVLAQRVLQFSADVPIAGGHHRMIPISFTHAPTPTKPGPKASSQQRSAYNKASRQLCLSAIAAQQITALRQALDAEPGGAARPLHLFVDNGYTNANVLKKLPCHTVLVGRLRKDAKLYFLPANSSSQPKRGRPLRYGDIAPTPEQLRVDDTVPWQTVSISLSGVTHSIRVKVLHHLLWRTAGLQHRLQLVVLAPVGYRLRKGSKLLYRKPGFLICTDDQMDLTELIQGYVQRWDIEVNFREEKTLLGVGQAQVRHPESVQSAPALQVASYAMLLLATTPATLQTPTDSLPLPKWSPAPKTAPRTSTQRAINQLRAEVWSRALGLRDFSDFVASTPPTSKPENFAPHLPSALFYASN
jgi:hypothetical protein